ncbi:MAG: LytR/AlgR family response regulator transcription factor [Luteibaculaceae bacterium]
MPKIKTLIVDDELNARAALMGMIKNFIPDLEVVDMAGNVPDAILSIKKHKPKVVFLDIEMPGYKGTDILKFFLPEEIDFVIIFVTAYDSFALKAFEMSAVDYLLKPTNKDLLLRAVDKARVFLKATLVDQNIKLNALKESIEKSDIKNMVFVNSAGLNIVPIDTIIYLKADGAYTHVYLDENKKLTCSKPLAEYMNLEHLEHFLRIQRSFLVNMTKVVRVSKKDGGFLELKNGEEIPFSADKKQLILDYFDKISL